MSRKEQFNPRCCCVSRINNPGESLYVARGYLPFKEDKCPYSNPTRACREGLITKFVIEVSALNFRASQTCS